MVIYLRMDTYNPIKITFVIFISFSIYQILMLCGDKHLEGRCLIIEYSGSFRPLFYLNNSIDYFFSGLNLNFCPPIEASNINPPLATVKTATPSS